MFNGGPQLPDLFIVMRQHSADCVLASTNEVLHALDPVASNTDDLPPIVPGGPCVGLNVT